MEAVEVFNSRSDVELGESGDEAVRAYGLLDDDVRRRWNIESGMQHNRPQEGSREALTDRSNFIVCVCVRKVNRPAERLQLAERTASILERRRSVV